MPPRKRVKKEESSDEASAYESDNSPSVEEALDSDDLDGETPPPSSQQATKRSKKRTSAKKSPEKKKVTAKPKEKVKPSKGAKATNGSSKKTTSTSSKKRKREEADEEFDEDDEEGVELIGEIVQAPTTGKVPAGRISQNTFNFLRQLKKPECNDREWFKLHEPVYRQAEKEWSDFVDKFTEVLTEVDDEIPHLPPRDIIHRIYRDVRFSNDKTPYKTNFSASFSRTGRKGIFAHYHVSVSPGRSILAAGVWCPGKNELETIRTQIRRNPTQLRDVISEPTFESLFGAAKWSKDKRQNIFGGEDQLKVAPKGVPKDHPDIDLLKCRSYAVVHSLTDDQVLSPDFIEILRVIADGAKPFVHRLNHMMTIQEEDDAEDAES